MKTKLKKTTKSKLIGISLFIVIFSLIAVYYVGKLNADYYIIDYDFYLEKDTLYAFVIEGKGVVKHNDINGKDYICGKRIMVFKKEIIGNNPT